MDKIAVSEVAWMSRKFQIVRCHSLYCCEVCDGKGKTYTIAVAVLIKYGVYIQTNKNT